MAEIDTKRTTATNTRKMDNLTPRHGDIAVTPSHQHHCRRSPTNERGSKAIKSRQFRRATRRTQARVRPDPSSVPSHVPRVDRRRVVDRQPPTANRQPRNGWVVGFTLCVAFDMIYDVDVDIVSVEATTTDRHKRTGARRGEKREKGERSMSLSQLSG